MKILYFIEPWIELSWPGFRFGSLNNYLYKEIDALVDIGHDVCLLVGDGLEFEAKKHNFNLKKYKHKVIRQKHLRKIAGDYTALYAQNNEEIIDALANLYKTCLDDFVPEIVMMWECKSEAIKKAFPKAKHISSNFGAMSRAPFPATQALDIFGNFGNSYISKLGEIRDYIEVCDEERIKFSRLKKKIKNVLSSKNPFREMDLLDKGKYENIILVPLQVSDYFAFEEYSNSRSQFDYLCNILDSTPSNTRVVVTEHGAFPSIFTPKNLDYLRVKYPNFFYHERFKKFKTSSQYLLNMVDGVVSCTSSVGLQAAMLDIPVYFSDKSPFKILSGCSSYKSFLRKLGQRDQSDEKNKLFIHLITKYWFIQEYQVHDGKWLNDYLDYVNNSKQDDFFYINSPFQIDIDLVSKYVRFSEFVDSNKPIEKKGFFVRSNNATNSCVYSVFNKKVHDKKWISFDIFDTLINRSLLNPKDIFNVVGENIEELLGIHIENFRDKRVTAEANARRLAQSNNVDEVNLDTIYMELSKITGLDSDLINKIKNIEIDSEIKYTGRRESGISLYERSISLGKSVYLISDMYLSKAHISKLLNKNGITFDDKNLFVSSEIGFQKRNGKLFDYFLEKEKLLAKDGLHIGDNHCGDGSSPLQKGIESIVIPKSIDCAKKSKNYSELLELASVDLQSNIVVSNIINRVFDYYTDEPCGFYNKDVSSFGYAVLGPMLLGFSIWLGNQAQKDGIDTINFLSRDGKIFKKAFDLYVESANLEVHTNYLYASRRSINVPCANNDDDINRLVLAPFSPCKLGFFLKYRLGLPDCKIKSYSVCFDMNRVVSRNCDYLNDVINKIKDDIRSNCRKEREALERYLSEQPIHSESCAIMDIGYRGSMQRSLQSFLGRNLKGYYLITTDESYDIDARAYLAENESRKNGHRFWQGVPIAEWLTLDSDTSVERFSLGENGVNVEFYEKTSSDIQRGEFTEEVHRGALDFISDYFKYSENYIPLSSQIIDETYLRFLSRPTLRESLIFEGKKLEDKFGGSGSRYLIPNLNNIATGKKIRMNYLASSWKPGALKIHESYRGILSAPLVPAITIDTNKIPFRRRMKNSNRIMSIWKFMKKNDFVKVKKK